jgi:hypothetical protein
MIRVLRITPAAFWPIDWARFERPHRTMCAGREATVDWLTIVCHQEVNVAAINIAVLPRDLSPLCLLLV